jgi:hypothetical protein
MLNYLIQRTIQDRLPIMSSCGGTMSNDNEHPRISEIIKDIDEHFINLMVTYKLSPLDICSIQLARQSSMMNITEGVDGLGNYIELLYYHGDQVDEAFEDAYIEQENVDSVADKVNYSAEIIPFKKKEDNNGN